MYIRRTTIKSQRTEDAGRPEPRQQKIYDALGIADRPGKTEKTIL